jgi:hypothetical protein
MKIPKNKASLDEGVWGSGCLDPRFMNRTSIWVSLPLYTEEEGG